MAGPLLAIFVPDGGIFAVSVKFTILWNFAMFHRQFLPIAERQKMPFYPSENGIVGCVKRTDLFRCVSRTLLIPLCSRIFPAGHIRIAGVFR